MSWARPSPAEFPAIACAALPLASTVVPTSPESTFAVPTTLGPGPTDEEIQQILSSLEVQSIGRR